VNRRRRDRHHSALVRGRLRSLFFLLLTGGCLLAGGGVAVVPAALGLVAGLLSVHVARRRGDDLAYSFAAVDWLLLGCAVALAGGAHGALVVAVPALPFIQLAGSARAEWPYLLLPALALVIVLATADPTLGGNRAFGLLELTALVASGAAAAALLRRPPRRTPVVSVDATTGFYTPRRLPALLDGLLDAVTREHDSLGVVYLRLSRFQDVRDFAGPDGSEALVATVARRIRRHLHSDDLAFRIAPDAFLLALPGRDLGAARALASAIDDDVAASLIGGHRQRVESGVACFPTVRRLDDLLREAHTNARHEQCELELAAAQ
jgi:diguanylate cyclase (GGDEF)-like protein